MLFNTFRFFIFFAIVLLLFYLGPRSWRKVVLLIASYYFYMCWNAKFVLLLLALTCIDYFAALWVTRSEGRVRKMALITSLGANLTFLGFFKYYNFLAESLVQLMGLPAHSFMLSIVLPVGISFHTFQSMSYVVDVYRGEQEVIRNPLDYALFIAFFPQLVAGPIVRAHEFFADLFHWRRPTGNEVLHGIFLTLMGLTKKIVLADQFASVANSYFNNISGNPGCLTAWSSTIAFALQIYFDFSGYTDMAIGVALLMGFHFPVNFRRPYLSQSITEFWRRWHISLSRWLRDYLYISLGGNRGGRLRTYRNLMLTMLLGGLWHGASWNFVIWGGYHGVLLSVERMFGVGKRERSVPGRLIGVVFTFGLVCISWVFFRAATLHDSAQVIGAMFSTILGTNLILPWKLWMAAVTLVLAVAEEHLEWFDRIVNAPAMVYATAIVFLLFCLELLAVTGKAVPFVYFQF
jgi:D-alanyl-lipoteichoic acid acyltransferase DltB (MBOAT superfamily)